MKPRLSQSAPLLLALALWCGSSGGHAVFSLQRDEEIIKTLRAILVRIDGDVKQGKQTKEQGQALEKDIAARIRELEEQLPARRLSAEAGRTDARRDIEQRRLQLFHIDRVFYPEIICTFGEDVPQSVWSQIVRQLTGASVLEVRPRDGNLPLLRARVDAYNQEVEKHLRTQHGPNFFERVRAEAKRTDEQSRYWGQTWERWEPVIPFLALLCASLLLARLVELRKKRARQAMPVVPA